MYRPALGHLLGYTALTVILTAGAAQSLAGSNTVDGGDIVDGSISSADIKDGGVLYADIKDGAITGTKLLDGSVSGADIRDNSVKGADIDESTLSLPHGSQGGVIAEPQLSGSQVLTFDAQGDEEAVDIVDGSFTQQAGQTLLVLGRATMTKPLGSCPDEVIVTVVLHTGSKELGRAQFTYFGDGEQSHEFGPGFVIPPNSPVGHDLTLTAELTSTFCSGGAPVTVTLTDFNADVVGL